MNVFAKAEAAVTHDELANAIRFLAIDAVEKANSGHPGMPMGMADVATILFTQFLKFDPADPAWHDRDRFVLSAGHGSMLLYALLYLTGYPEMTIEEIKNFRQLGSKTPGHPEYGHTPGVETTTGPLGQGLAMAVGMAIAEKLLAARYGNDLVDHRTYVIAGDGCLMEGVSQEAITLAGHLKLSKLIVLWDDNKITIDGAVSLADSTDQIARFKAAGWDAWHIDGHDPQAITDAFGKAQTSDRPVFIGCKTTIGFGAPTKAGTHGIHGSALGAAEITATREKLGWTAPAFEIPEPILNAWRGTGARGKALHEAWTARHAGGNSANFDRDIASTLSSALPETIAAFKRKASEADAPQATRISSQKTLEALAKIQGNLLGGSADLTGSNNTKAADMRSVTPEDFSGRYLHYGIREFGMAAAMNGLALHGGFIPYGGTFLVFADYARPAIRLAALMRQHVVYVLTHDSIGLGEDGPTHQPVETLASLRVIPHLNVFRPADAVETAEAWELALRFSDAPTVLALSRQNLPVLRRMHNDENLSAKGAYVLREAAGERDVTLIATGSEVSLAVAAADELAKDNVKAAVVSLPCFELFAAQEPGYRAAVLGQAPRIGIEAALRQGWGAVLAPEDYFIGMKDFGASAPAGDLYKHFGITIEAIVNAARAAAGHGTVS